MQIPKTLFTLPKYQEVANKGVRLTDFTKDTSRLSYYTKLAEERLRFRHQAGRYQYGSISLREHGKLADEIATYNLETGDCQSQIPNNLYQAIAPHIQNPASSGWATTKIASQDVLTHNGQVCIWPATLADRRTTARLEHFYRRGDNKKLKLVGAFSLPHHFNFEEQQILTCMELCYAYQGNLYTHTQIDKDHYLWHRCEPVRAARQENGSIQCLDTLYISQIDAGNFLARPKTTLPNGDIDIAQSALGKMLNEKTVHDLMLSAHLYHAYMENAKLAQPKAVFSWQHLKQQISELVR